MANCLDDQCDGTAIARGVGCGVGAGATVGCDTTAGAGSGVAWERRVAALEWARELAVVSNRSRGR